MQILHLPVALIVASASFLPFSTAHADEPIKIGIDASYRPYAFIDTNGEVAGFEPELIKAACAEIKATCDISSVPWDGIWTALDTGTIDMVGTTVTVSKERLEKYDASRVIYKVGYAFLVSADTDISAGIAGLKGKAIGTIVGTAPYYAYIKATLGDDTQIQGYESPDSAVLDLDAGRIAAFQSDNLQLEEQFVSGGQYKLVGEPNFDKEFTGDGRGWFFSKGSTNLVTRINEGLDAVIASGKLEELGMKYFNTKLKTE